MNLDPEGRDQDRATAQFYANEFFAQNLSEINKACFNHALISTKERYGDNGTRFVIKQIQDQMREQNPKSPLALVSRIPASKGIPNRAVYDLHNTATNARNPYMQY